MCGALYVSHTRGAWSFLAPTRVSRLVAIYRRTSAESQYWRNKWVPRRTVVGICEGKDPRYQPVDTGYIFFGLGPDDVLAKGGQAIRGPKKKSLGALINLA
jgi:hypothetical protein